MAKIWFLEANLPLTKSYALNAKQEITTSAYPIVSKFKSHATTCDTLKDFYTQLVEHSKKGHCLIKGILHHELSLESRRKSTQTLDKTEWVCLDLDGAPFKSPEEMMSQHPALKDVSYVVQYSASEGLGKPGIRCHVFFYLDSAYNATYLKSWLMEMNLDGNLFKGVLRRNLSMNDAGTCIKWPVDITCCQNDKLLYIAPPTVEKGIEYNPPAPRIQYVAKKLPCLPTSRLAIQKIEFWKKEQRTVLNAMRKEAGLTALRATRIADGHEVQGAPGEATITGIRTDDEFVRLNLNGGDSWAYWHPKNDFTYIHSFKGEPSCLTKELLPSYYQDCLNTARHEATQPTADGEIILGVCDTRSALLWKVSWNPKTADLNLYPAKGDKQITDWLLQHGKVPGDFVPQWQFEFNPSNKVIVDIDKQYLNTYVPSKYYKNKVTKVTELDNCPTIKKVLISVTGNDEWGEITEHFMNWLAVLFQHKIKIGTTWLFSGTEGTGKNLLSNHIMRPLIGSRYVKEVLITGLEDQFNGWLETCLLCFVNEIQVSSSQHRKIVSGKLRNWITDSPLDIRPMGVTRYDADNYCNFIMNSNERDAVDINNADRRYNFGLYQENKLAITEHEVSTLIPKELPAFFNYLMSRPASITEARRILESKTRKDTILANRNSVDMLADALLDGDISPFLEALPDIRHISVISGRDSTVAVAFHSIVTRELELLTNSKPTKGADHRVESKLTRDELFILFDHCVGNMPSSPNKFTRLLKHKRIETKKIRINDGTAYGVHVTWTASAEFCDEYRPEKQKLRRVK